MSKIGRPVGAKNATPSQLRERAKALLKEAQLKERIEKLKSSRQTKT